MFARDAETIQNLLRSVLAFLVVLELACGAFVTSHVVVETAAFVLVMWESVMFFFACLAVSTPPFKKVLAHSFGNDFG